MKKILLMALALLGLSGYVWAGTPAASSASPVVIVGTSPISGTVTVTQGTGTNLHTVVDSGTITAVTSITNPVAVTGTFWQATQPVTGTFYQATQPVSAASLPLPTGAATEATLATLDGKVTACNTGAVVLTPTTTVNHAQVSIPVTAGGTLLIATNASRKSLLIQNIGSFAMFCGNTGLSATTGFQVAAGSSFLDDTAVFTGAVYCIGSGGTTTAAYREVQ